MTLKPSRRAAPERPYRGLYAGVSEVAHMAQVSRQYAAAHLGFAVLREPIGYLDPVHRKRPYWFLRDAEADLRRVGRLRQVYPESPRIEEWEREHQGPVIGVGQFAQLACIPSGNVHTLADYWGDLARADTLRMGTVWRESDVENALQAHGYPRKSA